MKKSNPLEFLAKAQENPKLSARVLTAVERGGKLTAEEILQIAHEFGYSFTKSEFEKAVRRKFANRFAAFEDMVETKAALKKKPKPKPPESSCAKGCLSYTVSWHPSRVVVIG
jgi:hypothetical protein